MLLTFKFSNFLSFRDEVQFSCLATRERQHNDHVYGQEGLDIKVLPTAAIWGANGSGKSNLYYALRFARRFILRGKSRPEDAIDAEPFRLDAGNVGKASTFVFEILSDGHVLRYSFAVTRDHVVSESLQELRRGKTTTIFSRALNRANETDWNTGFFAKLEIPKEDKDFIEFKTRDVLPNQLFLTELRGKKVPMIDHAADWFRKKLVLIDPNSAFKQIEFTLKTAEEFRRYSTECLARTGTGISELTNEIVSLEAANLPQEMKVEARKIIDSSKKDSTMALVRSPEGHRYFIFRENDELRAMQLITYHVDSDGKPVRFEMPDESEGTQRLIDLLPAFYELSDPQSEKVFFVDELDRSLHTHLTRSLIEGFLKSRETSSQGQLLLTTHDGLLMDQDLFRRDEIWFIDKDKAGASSLMSLSDFKGVRYDKDIRKSYLQGRYGGIPEIWSLPQRMTKTSES